MPTPEAKAKAEGVGQIPNAVLRQLFDQPQPDLAHEVAMLRRELAELRSTLVPTPSSILTGPQVAAEFKRLKGGA